MDTTRRTWTGLVPAVVVLLIAFAAPAAGGPGDVGPSGATAIAFLGTGTPNPDPRHSGNSVVIVVRDTPYIFDAGPGLVRRAAALSPAYGGTMKGLAADRLTRVFFTHLHSDHTTGYPDLILTPWVMGRDRPLQVYGPAGIVAMTRHILEAYGEDIKVRLTGLEKANDQGWRAVAHEFKEGLVYKDDLVAVHAFRVDHGGWEEAYGFKVVTRDRTICISGDTRPCGSLVEHCTGVDVLIHEVYSHDRLKTRPPKWQAYHPAHHTSTRELAAIAKKAHPGLLILYHQLYWGSTDEQLLKEIAADYRGKVVSARDLDVF